MAEVSSPVASPDHSPESPSSYSDPSSPWHYLAGLIVTLSCIAGVVILSVKGQLTDVGGHWKLAALAWMSLAASERGRIAAIAIRGWFRRGK
jgi:hypothetical protein